jgi:phage protein D
MASSLLDAANNSQVKTKAQAKRKAQKEPIVISSDSDDDDTTKRDTKRDKGDKTKRDKVAPRPSSRPLFRPSFLHLTHLSNIGT